MENYVVICPACNAAVDETYNSCSHEYNPWSPCTDYFLWSYNACNQYLENVYCGFTIYPFNEDSYKTS